MNLPLDSKLKFGALTSIISPTYTAPGSVNVFLKNDSETATLVRGMLGLFEPVFPLTTNKYPCQSVSVYLACLSAIHHVFSCA